ncbi:L,D-transpeptidase family protein [Dyadobacter fermentans]|uniref:ErfK/YbiS/YcfS/YnhG family protein n=1 Tax=Dyadobacter fermentans (strain ATCC 700827 / DSM 18053 / CIP 107007 / KCTC 52180 / NS114) TaxID=471854 RepID=C6W6L0_DYAFD|nr:L,D-transpeptidase family protein [Dyadobacter fermentans]ACT94350.1 ErfK/YbiS/YcfS/YnhG family protein [Dyadobacter fermentans DSM 18053]
MQMLSGLGKARYVPLLILFTLAIMQSCRKNPKEMTNAELAEAIGSKDTYQELLTAAAKAGVDTRKFEAGSGTAPVFALLEEVAFGHKPTIRFTQKKVKADTLLIRNAAEDLVKGQSVEKVLEKLEPVFPVYNNLKIHYDRLLKAQKKDSAAYVAQTLNAYRWIHRQIQGSPRFVLVNIRGAYLTAMDSAGQNVLTMRTVVGKRDTPTPTIDTYATSIVTHPYWNVPKSIAIKEIFPKAAADPEYLSRNRIQVIGKDGQAIDPQELDWGDLTAEKFPYRFRQETGEDNSLGLLKVEIKNPLAIYLHDTNARYLFKSGQRWRSHGCVRVQYPTDLANYMAGSKLLDSDFMTEPDSVSHPPKWHKLQVRIPVFLLYLPADCNPKGDLMYFPDVYKRETPNA